MTKSHEWMSEEERKELEVGKYKSAPTFEGGNNLGSFPRIIRFISKNLTLNDIEIMLFDGLLCWYCPKLFYQK